ncbi:MAG: Flp family type IVb pilin [Deltaproteobacteria bacterium]|nr:Flp family type IVb pilin [Deltaproteobacteria bacterium]
MTEKIIDNKDLQSEKKERGASLVEYALLLALIAVVCIVAIRVIGTKASSQFSSIASQL